MGCPWGGKRAGSGSALLGGDGRKCCDLLFYLIASAVRALQFDGVQVGDVENFGKLLFAIQTDVHIMRHRDPLSTPPLF